MMTSDYMHPPPIDNAQSKGRHESSLPSHRSTLTLLNLMTTSPARLSDMRYCRITLEHATPRPPTAEAPLFFYVKIEVLRKRSR